MDKLDEIPGIGHALRPGAHRRDRRGHDRLPHRRAPGVLGQVRPDRRTVSRHARRAAPPARATPGWPAPSARSSPALARTNTFLGDRYRRLARRRGKKRAIVAVGNSVLTIIWHLLSDPDARYHDLGPDYYESRINKQRRQRDLIRQLEHLTGQKVTLHPAA